MAKPEILVVDDDPKNLMAIEAALSDFDGTIDMVRSGSEALHNLLEREYALILLDVHMPDLDGFETAKLVRQRAKTKHLPIIFATAYDQSDSRVHEGYELGAVDFLFKPIEPTILRAKVSVFVELARRTAEVERQAQQLWMLERREALARLEEERRRWEQDSLRREMLQQRKLAEETAARAEQLAEIAAQRERQQAELARINERLAEGDRRKNEFLATLAHELRNPLTPLGYAIGLLRDSDDEMVLDISERMNRQLAHLTRLVDDLLDVSRVASGKIELRRAIIDLRDAVRQGVEIGDDVLRKDDRTLVVDLGDAPVLVEADAVRIAQVVGNLVNNAARYTTGGGCVEVRLGVRDGRAQLVVQDDGPGIPDSMLDAIFDAFVQGSSTVGGLGLGLYLSERLIDMHDGTIRASNRATGGARFEIVLDLTEADQAEVEDDVSASTAHSDSLLVAIIEDELDVRAMSRLLLQHWGNETIEASNGQRGIELVRERADAIDIVLVDIGLPDMAGYDVARVLHEILGERCPPLVAVTGWGQERDREQAMAAGFDAHLVKPVRPDELRATLATFSRGRAPHSSSATRGEGTDGDD